MKAARLAWMLPALILSAPSPASSEDAPKGWTVDMTKPVLDETGAVARDTLDPLRALSVKTVTVEEGPQKGQVVTVDTDPQCKKCQDLTVGVAVAHALNLYERDERVDGETKRAWSDYAESIKRKPDARIDGPHAKLIVDRLGRIYNGFTLRQVVPLIDPNRAVQEIK